MTRVNFVILMVCLASLVIPCTSQEQSEEQQKHQYVGYFFTQSENNADQGNGLLISQIPPYVTTIIVGSIQPDAQYQAGSFDVSGTGLTLVADGQVFADGIALAKEKGSRVLISVGTFSQLNWEALNSQAIADFVSDFGFDGIEINFRVQTPACTVGNDGVSCESDQLFQDVVNDLRQALPSPLFVAAAITGVGAYGQGDFRDSQPQTESTGFGVNLLQSDAGASLDLINIQSFENREGYDPQEGFNAFKSLFNKTVTIGIGVPPEGADEADALSVDDIGGLCDFVIQNGGLTDGISLTSLDRRPDGSISEANPNPTLMSQEICTKFELEQCDASLDFFFSPSGKDILAPTQRPNKRLCRRKRNRRL